MTKMKILKEGEELPLEENDDDWMDEDFEAMIEKDLDNWI
jgi:hypothetical protein